MTDNTKAISLKLQAAKRNAAEAGHVPATRKVFLGNFAYAEFMPYKGSRLVKITDEDGCGRPIDTILLDKEQMFKLISEYLG